VYVYHSNGPQFGNLRYLLRAVCTHINGHITLLHMCFLPALELELCVPKTLDQDTPVDPRGKSPLVDPIGHTLNCVGRLVDQAKGVRCTVYGEMEGSIPP